MSCDAGFQLIQGQFMFIPKFKSIRKITWVIVHTVPSWLAQLGYSVKLELCEYRKPTNHVNQYVKCSQEYQIIRTLKKCYLENGPMNAQNMIMGSLVIIHVYLFSYMFGHYAHIWRAAMLVFDNTCRYVLMCLVLKNKMFLLSIFWVIACTVDWRNDK